MQGVQGWPAQVCPSCGSVLLEARAARQILGADAVLRQGQSDPPAGWHASTDPLMSDARIAIHLENLRAERQRRLTIAIGLATAIVVLVLAVPLSVVVYGTVRDQVAARRPTPPALEEALAPEPAVVVAPAPSPALVATEPEPEPVQAEPASATRALIRQGWALADRRDPAAADRFRAALAERPGDPEATYGLGYVYLQAGDTVAARRYLCAAVGGGDEEMRREIRALLERNKLSCAP